MNYVLKAEIWRFFFDFYSTLILYFKLRKDWGIREVESSNIKWLILSFKDYVFYLKFTFNNDFHEVQMIITEDSINKKIVLILRCNNRILQVDCRL